MTEELNLAFTVLKTLFCSAFLTSTKKNPFKQVSSHSAVHSTSTLFFTLFTVI